MLAVSGNPNVLHDIINWDVGTWSHALNFWAPPVGEVRPEEWAVEIGARAGGLSLFFALNGLKVLSTDLENPQPFGEQVHSKYEQGKSITYLCANATSLPLRSGQVAIAGCKSVLGSVARNNNLAKAQETVDEIYRILKPGGIMIFAENLKGTGLHMILRRRFVTWAQHYLYFSLPELEGLFSNFSDLRFETRGFTALTGRNENQRRLLAKIDTVLRPLTPRSWRYLAYGYARK